MKLWILVFTITLLFTAGEALNCHRCVPKVPGGDCELTEQTCKQGRNGCVAVGFTTAPYSHYQKCMSVEDCELLKLNAYLKVTCCAEDLCNTSLKTTVK